MDRIDDLENRIHSIETSATTDLLHSEFDELADKATVLAAPPTQTVLVPCLDNSML